jgi:ADP-heptose:LPS heptosyltransferase
MALAASRSPRILVIRRDNIGDLVCTTPLFDGLRRAQPNAWIGALVNTYNAEVLARNPALDAVYVYEKLKHRKGSLFSNLLARARLSSVLRRLNFDYVLVPAPTPRTLRLAASLSPREIIALPPIPEDHRHEVERTYALGEALGVTGMPGPMRIFPDANVQEEVRRRIGPGPFVAVHISARRPAQRWPAERYAELLNELKKKSRVLLLWAPGAHDDPRHPGDDTMARTLVSEGITPLPTRDLKTLVAALSLADCLICPDGGAMHIAAALGKPIVALFGDSPVERWRPWGVPHEALRPVSSRNLGGLLLEPVLEAASSVSRWPRGRQGGGSIRSG